MMMMMMMMNKDEKAYTISSSCESYAQVSLKVTHLIKRVDIIWVFSRGTWWILLKGFNARKHDLLVVTCEQQSRRSACAYAQADQRLCYSLSVCKMTPLTTHIILIFWLDSEIEQTGLHPIASQIPKTGFLTLKSIYTWKYRSEDQKSPAHVTTSVGM